jgi:hydroxyacylglutathione hydrolase
MKILHIPCLEDNYSYIIIDEATKQAAAVDPVEPEKVIQVAKDNSVDLKLVLTTHHHWDHAGGNEKIKELVPGIKVYGGSIDKVKGCTDKVDNGDKLTLGADTNILCLHTPWYDFHHANILPPISAVLHSSIIWYQVD